MYKYSIRLLFAGFCAVLFTGSALAAPTLAERRAITAYESGAYATHLKDIQTAAGFAVPVEVKWDAIAVSGESGSYGEDGYWTNIFFVPLKKALASVTVDAMGKTALKEHLKKIVIDFDKATAPISDYAKGVSFKDGVLTLNFQPYTNASDIDPRAEAIQKVLENAL